MDGMLIARARLDKHVLDKTTGIVMPHLIALEWPQAKLQINLEIGQIDVNPTTIPPRNWEVPKKSPYYPAFDIGAMSRKQSQIAGATAPGVIERKRRLPPPTAPVLLQGPPPNFGAPSPLAAPRRPAASLGHSSGSWPETDGSSEFNQPIQATVRVARPVPGIRSTEIRQMPSSPRAPASSPSRRDWGRSVWRSAAGSGARRHRLAQLGAAALRVAPVSSNGDPFESMPH